MDHALHLLRTAEVEDVVIKRVNETAVLVSWKALDLPVSYVVFYSRVDSRRRQNEIYNKTFSVGSSSGIIAGLVGGADYIFQVVAALSTSDGSFVLGEFPGLYGEINR